ncbi:MAG: hypothetical protein OSB68_02635 [Dehalococcoidia bacterium]|nr:hypothetical protein [Dehalococcoidia bacterium]
MANRFLMERSTLIADDHCGWEYSTLLHIGMPLGTAMESGADVH